jgi:hypothetical protein
VHAGFSVRAIVSLKSGGATYKLLISSIWVSVGIDFCKYIPRKLSACGLRRSLLLQEMAMFRKNIYTPSIQDEAPRSKLPGIKAKANKTLSKRVNIDYPAPIGFV